MEGYAKANIRAVEPSLLKVREFAQKESVAAARRLLDDLGLKAVSSSNQIGLAEPGDARARALEDLKWKVELAQAIGADRLVAPSAGTGPYGEEDYKRGAENLREAGEIAKPFGVSIMLEFVRTSRFAAQWRAVVPSGWCTLTSTGFLRSARTDAMSARRTASINAASLWARALPGSRRIIPRQSAGKTRNLRGIFESCILSMLLRCTSPRSEMRMISSIHGA